MFKFNASKKKRTKKKERKKSTYVINVGFYKSSKLILCTKVMKNLVYLFAKSQFVVLYVLLVRTFDLYCT
jgi:hypothetical protein